jgi:hypothetical protein
MTPAERKEQARLSARGIIDIVIAECSVNRHATPEERSIFERAVVAVDAYAAACVAEALTESHGLPVADHVRMIKAGGKIIWSDTDGAPMPEHVDVEILTVQRSDAQSKCDSMTAIKDMEIVQK